MTEERTTEGIKTEKANQKSNKKTIIGVVAFVAVIAVLAAVFFIFREKPVAGSKAITIEVVNKEQETTTYKVQTDAEYLRQAMEEAEAQGLTFSGTEGDFGLMVDTVNGVRADYVQDGAYWGFFVNDDYCEYSIDQQPILDGDVFKIAYTLAE